MSTTLTEGASKTNGAGEKDRVVKVPVKLPAKPAARKKTTGQTPKRRFQFVQDVVAYIRMDPALLLKSSRKPSRDQFGATRDMNRTNRFENAKVYKAGADHIVIQTATGEEHDLSIQGLRALLDAAEGLGITRELPPFGS